MEIRMPQRCGFLTQPHFTEHLLSDHEETPCCTDQQSWVACSENAHQMYTCFEPLPLTPLSPHGLPQDSFHYPAFIREELPQRELGSVQATLPIPAHARLSSPQLFPTLSHCLYLSVRDGRIL